MGREHRALLQIATRVAEAIQLILPLDTFGDRPKRQRGGDLDDRPRESRLIGVAGKAIDEGLVDLQNVDREALQIGKR